MSGEMAVGAAVGMGATGDDLPRNCCCSVLLQAGLPLAGQSEEGGRLLSACWIVSWRLFCFVLCRWSTEPC